MLKTAIKSSKIVPQLSIYGFYTAGEPGQLEASLRQLDQALDAGRYHLQQREATAKRSSPDVDSTYMGYVSI